MSNNLRVMKQLMKMCSALVTVITLQLPLNAQERTGFTVGIASDLFAVPLTNNSAMVRAGTASLGYGIGKHLNFAVGWENHLMLNQQLSEYESKNGLLLETEYRMWSKQKKRSVVGFNVQLVKGGEKIVSANDYSLGAGVRWYSSGNFFIGSGVRYDDWNSVRQQAQHNASINWYWQLGFKIVSVRKISD
jgi:hypothetical protein